MTESPAGASKAAHIPRCSSRAPNRVEYVWLDWRLGKRPNLITDTFFFDLYRRAFEMELPSRPTSTSRLTKTSSPRRAYEILYRGLCQRSKYIEARPLWTAGEGHVRINVEFSDSRKEVRFTDSGSPGIAGRWIKLFIKLRSHRETRRNPSCVSVCFGLS